MLIRASVNYTSTVVALILILHANISSKTLGSSLPILSTPTIIQQNTGKLCGTVHTSSGKTVTLLQGERLTPEKFNQVRNITLNRSLFSPVRSCAIQVCGFISLGTLMQEGYIGSTSDISKCLQFTKEKHGDKLFQQPFYTSSISCGCKSSTSSCLASCTDARTNTWSDRDNDCAVLYEERDCNTCYLPHIHLSKNKNYTTDNAHHITSLIIRPQCKVLHWAPAMRRMYWLKDRPQPLVYEYKPKKQYDVISSAYQSDEPDTFHCVCEEEEETPLVIPEIPKKRDTDGKRLNIGKRDPGDKRVSIGKLDKSGKLDNIGSWGTTIGATIAVLLTIAIIGIFVLRRKVKCCGNGNQMNGVTMSPEHDSPVCPESSTSEGQQAEGNISKENKLEKKLDDVKKLLELLCGGGGGGASFQNQAEPLLKNNEAVAAVMDQFESTCNPENIVTRDKILFRKDGNCLGTGQFGTVYKGVLKNDWDGLNEVVAVKVVEWVGCTDEHIKSFLREIKMYQDVGAGSQYIVRLMGACVHEDGLFILTQFCAGGSLKDYLVNELRPKVYVEPVKQLGDGYSSSTMDSNGKLIYHRDKLIERQLIKFSEQIACGMEWLSGKGIIHGDLAVRNVLLSGDYRTAKICDLGLSRKCVGREYVLDSLSKFPYNSLAPELCKSDERAYKLTSNVDAWAYGCTLFEIFTLGECVYSHIQLQEPDKVIEVMRLLVFEEYRHSRPDTMPDDMWDKLLECWAEEPEKRPNFTELRQFFEEMN